MLHLIYAHLRLDPNCSPLHTGNASTSQQQRQQLQSNPAWEASRFGDLETFIFDFLSGTAGGEGVRLKLQTPLNISQALLDAATQQVQDDLEVAKQVILWGLDSEKDIYVLMSPKLCRMLPTSKYRTAWRLPSK